MAVAVSPRIKATKHFKPLFSSSKNLTIISFRQQIKETINKSSGFDRSSNLKKIHYIIYFMHTNIINIWELLMYSVDGGGGGGNQFSQSQSKGSHL